jgi:hypothetical protein
MGKNRKNDLTLGISGRVGKMIGFRQVGDETEVFRRPGKRTKPLTPDQLAHHERFINASYYAKSVIADPVKKAVYDAKRTGRVHAYNMALSDFIKAPEIKLIDTTVYHGQAGNSIVIRAIDDFKVATVKVSIMDANGVLLEQGGAVLLPGDVDWLYTTTVVNPQLTGSKIICTASDLPGNEAKMEKVL